MCTLRKLLGGKLFCSDYPKHFIVVYFTHPRCQTTLSKEKVTYHDTLIFKIATIDITLFLDVFYLFIYLFIYLVKKRIKYNPAPY